MLIGFQTTRPDQFMKWLGVLITPTKIGWQSTPRWPPEVHLASLTNCLYIYSTHIYKLVLLTCMRSNDKHCYNLKGSFSWKSLPNWEQNFLSHSFSNYNTFQTSWILFPTCMHISQISFPFWLVKNNHKLSEGTCMYLDLQVLHQG